MTAKVMNFSEAVYNLSGNTIHQIEHIPILRYELLSEIYISKVCDHMHFDRPGHIIIIL